MPRPVSRRGFLASTLALLAANSSTCAREGKTLTVLDDLLSRFMKDNELPGAAVALSHAGRQVYARGFGFADVANKVPVKPGSLFRIASLSKPITAVAVLQLVDRGKVKLDDPVLKYVAPKPFLAADAKRDERWERITIRHCLQHTGGWNRDKKGGYDPIGIPRIITREMRLAGPPSAEEVVRYMLGQPLDFEPGAKYAYSNLGYLILGRVIEAVSGEKYERWVSKNVLTPIGASAMRLGRALPENRASGEVKYYDSNESTGRCIYPPRIGERVPVPDGVNNIEGYEAHGGWIASAVDLVRFAAAFDYGRKSPILSANSIKEMWARPAGAPGVRPTGKPRATYYGCGWQVRPVGTLGRVNAWHTGLISGTSALLVRRTDDVSWAILFNTDANPDGDHPANLIDGPFHGVIDETKVWPDRDLFSKYSTGT